MHDAGVGDVVAPLEPSAEQAGRPLQLILVSRAPDAYVALIYSAKRISDSDTIEELFNAGGILVVQAVPTGRDGDSMKENVGKRASLVEVGPYRAALVHAEPWVSGVRAYNLYWSDGKHDWSIQGATATPEEVIDLARSLYCT